MGYMFIFSILWLTEIVEAEGPQWFKKSVNVYAAPIRHVALQAVLICGMPVRLMDWHIFIVIHAAGVFVLPSSSIASWVIQAKLLKGAQNVSSIACLHALCIVLDVAMGCIIVLKLQKWPVIQGLKVMLTSQKIPNLFRIKLRRPLDWKLAMNPLNQWPLLNHDSPILLLI